MTAPGHTSLTGSASGAPTTHLPSVSRALGRLRQSVVLVCWFVVLAIVAQIVVWSLVAFTQIRWIEITPSDVPLIVTNDTTLVQPTSLDEVGRIERGDDPDPVHPNRVASPANLILAMVGSVSGGLLTLATLLLLPLITLGVLLASGSATEGVEKTVSAFTWTVILGLLVLPIGDWAGLPWRAGAVWEYEEMVAAIDASPSVFRTALHFLLLPCAACMCVLIVLFQFHAGVERGLILKEDIGLDLELESEAGNIRPTSLHGGGRSASALHRATDVMDGKAATTTATTAAKSDAPFTPTLTGDPPPAPPSPATADVSDEAQPRRVI